MGNPTNLTKHVLQAIEACAGHSTGTLFFGGMV